MCSVTVDSFIPLFQVWYKEQSKLFKFNGSVRFRDAIDVIRYRFEIGVLERTEIICPPSTRFSDDQLGKSFHDLGNFK